MKKVNDISLLFRLYLASNFEWQKEAADYFACSDAMISAVARGKKQPTKAMLNAMGVKKQKTTNYYIE